MKMRILLLSLAVVFFSAVTRAEFQAEPIGKIESLPEQYPEHWTMVHDFSFFHMFEGEVLVVDPLADNLGDQYKGMITASFIAGFETSRARQEHYVIETFMSRGSRGGERTDVVTIYDWANLSVQDEVVIPAKRITGMPKTTVTNFLADGKFLGVYNFTPAQSVSIVNLESRKFVAEVATPGCGFVFPTGNGFSSICANGSFLTTHLDKNGEASGSSKTDQLFDANDDPIFEGPAIVDGVAYFVTFQGEVLPLNIKGKNIKAKSRWWLSGDDERNWRPGGMNIITADASGVAYVLMNPAGGEGTHKDGGAEVWVVDLNKRQRLDRIELKNWGLSLGTSGRGENRLLHVTNAEMAVDVYKIPTGEFVQTLNTGAVTPFLVHGAQ